jgi:GNAT superfamily N-acetyltransferase
VNVGVVAEQRTRDLRRAVLRPHLPPDAPLPGDDRPGGVHLGAVDDDGTVVGTCFVYPEPCPWLPQRAGAWRLRQMATADGHRGRGIGGLVVAAAVDYVRTQGAGLIWCHARQVAAPFYARHGFVVHGDVFIDDAHPIPHLRMWRDLREPSAGAIASTV